MTVSENDFGKHGACVGCGKPIHVTREKAQPVLDITSFDTEVALPPPAEEDGVPHDWNVGDIILNLYEITGLLGEGGMGKVFKVRHRRWNMFLAVKSPKLKTLEKTAGAINFERECETWINLGLHPNVVSCYYVRRLGGMPRVFAEYVEGQNLWQLIRSGALYKGDPKQTFLRILDIFIQFAWGLQFAHDRGVIHQDVKPANLMITPAGVAKVTDFGLARAKAYASQAPGADTPEGQAFNTGMTRAYCSPEQARKEALTVKTDIWSWAVSLFETLLGTVTWKAGHQAGVAFKAQVNSPQVQPKIPIVPEIAQLIAKCLQENPDARPESLREIAAILQNIYAKYATAPYARKEPSAAEALADSINNRALSLVDLGHAPQAETVWETALKTDPQHPESTYNLSLARWRSGRLTDAACLARLQEVASFHPGEWLPHFLIALIHLERSDFRSALNSLKEIKGIDPLPREVTTAMGQVQQYFKVSRGIARTIKGHNDDITSVVCLADGKHILTGSDDNTLKLWDLDTGGCVGTFEGHSNNVTSVAVSADGSYALSGGRDRTVRLWDTAQRKLLFTVGSHNDAVWSVALDADARKALTAGGEGVINVWDVHNGEIAHSLSGHRGPVTAIALAEHVGLAASGGLDRTVRVWRLAEHTCLILFSEHESAVSGVAFSPDGNRLVSSSHDGTVRVWDIPASKCVHTLPGHNGVVYCVAVSADGRYYASGGKDRTVRLWDAATGRCLCTFTGHTDEVTGVSFHPTGRYLVSVSRGKTINLWHVGSADLRIVATTMMCQARASEELLSASQQFSEELNRARSLFKQGNVLGTAQALRKARNQPGRRRTQEAMQEWRKLYTRLPKVKLNSAWEAYTIPDVGDSLKALGVVKRGQNMVTLSGESRISLWDLADGRRIRDFDVEPGTIETVCVTPDGRTTLSGGWQIKAWHTDQGTAFRDFDQLSDLIGALDVSRDGRFALAAYAKYLSVWHVQTGRELRAFQGHTQDLSATAFCADSRYALSGGQDKVVRMWDLVRGQCVAMMEGHSQSIQCLAASGCGRWALSGSGAFLAKPGELRLWDLEQGICRLALEGHSGSIESVCFSADNRYALSGGSDKTMILWDLVTGKRVHTFEGHDDIVLAVAMTDDSRYAVSAGKDGTVKVWTLDWELEDRQPALNDPGADPYIRRFLLATMPYAGSIPDNRLPTEAEVTNALSKKGRSNWTTDELNEFLYDLGCAGYGWLHPQGVLQQLKDTAAAIKPANYMADPNLSKGFMSRLFGR
ncbi:MAG: hypothetical protein AMXMBFR84_29700 [Candidatus Hydrogenedentota bacterium]